MSSTPFIYQDGVPVTTLDTTDINHHAQVCLALDTTTTYGRVSDHLKLIATRLGTETPTVDIALTAEAFLYTLYTLSTILSPDGQSITPHRAANRTPPELPDEQTLITRMYGGKTNWAAPYGSLGYFNTYNNIPARLHPTDLVDRAIVELTSRAGLGDWAITRKGDDDYALYNTLFRSLGAIEPALRTIDFLQRWIGPVLVGNLTNPVLLDIKAQMQTHVLSTVDLDAWVWQLLHHSLGPTVRLAIDDIISYALHPIDTSAGPERTWLEALYTQVPKGTSQTLAEDTRAYIATFAPPGGFNMLLIGLAADMLNRAVILLYRGAVTVRIQALLYRAGLLLRRSNIETVVALGHNLGILSQIRDDYPLQIRSYF